MADINSISAACLFGASHTISKTSGKRSGSIPGREEYVAPFKEKSQFSHNVWVDCGRPKTGAVSDIMRRTRAAYHKSIRYVKKHEKDITNDRFASALLQNRNRDFLSEAKRIRRNKACFKQLC